MAAGVTSVNDDEYGFASLGPVEVHVSRNTDHDPRTTAGCAYLAVTDADALWRRWSAAGGGRNLEPVTTDYGTREGAHIDPDGNLLRYGSLPNILNFGRVAGVARRAQREARSARGRGLRRGRSVSRRPRTG